MNRKTFIESQGATCANWHWAWSFINKHDKFVIFGLWDDNETDDGGMILGRKWEKSEKGRRNPGYREALKHIELVTESRYALLTYPQFAKRDADGKVISRDGRISIKKIDPVLERRFVFEAEDGWYSTRAPMPPASSYEPLVSQRFEEGKKADVLARRVERSSAARRSCLKFHGYACKVCSLAMSDLYGPIGEEVIEVHHLHELALCREARQVDPTKDLVPVCPNCHTIIHKKRPAYMPDEVRRMLRRSPDDPHPDHQS